MKSDREGYYLVNEVKELLGCTDNILKNKLIASGALKFEQFEAFGFRYFPKEVVLRIKSILDERRANLAAFEAEQLEKNRRALELERQELLAREQELTELRDQLKEINTQRRKKILAKQEREREQQRLAVIAADNERRLVEANERERLHRIHRERQELSKRYSNLPVDMQMFIKDSERLGYKWKGVNCTGYLNKCASCGRRADDERSLFVSYDSYEGFLIICENKCDPDKILENLQLSMLRVNRR